MGRSTKAFKNNSSNKFHLNKLFSTSSATPVLNKTTQYFNRLSSFKGIQGRHTTKNTKNFFFSYSILTLTSLSSPPHEDLQALGFLDC